MQNAANDSHPKGPLGIAVIATAFHPISHADVIVTRWAEPRATDPQYGWKASGKTRIASLFVDQIPDNDMSAEFGKRHGVPVFDSIADALTLGGDQLAVDAVCIIGEHGNYPHNELGQKLYPRKELFNAVTAVFARSGRNVPVFFDKHFSWNPDWALEMYNRIRRDGIPFFGGSSLPYSPTRPPLGFPTGEHFDEVVAIYWNALEDYLFHSLEFVQSVVETRAGGECGVESITAWKDMGVWDAMESGAFSAELLEAAAYSVSDDSWRKLETLRTNRGAPVYAFQLIHRDGLKTTHFMQHDLIRKWAAAFKPSGGRAIQAGCPTTDGPDHYYPHFARLNRKIEDFFLSGEPPIPLERLLFTTLATAACMRALANPGVPIKTPEITLPPAGLEPDTASVA